MLRLDDSPPGEEAQVDFGLMDMLHDSDTRGPWKLRALIVDLSHSSESFVYPTFTKELEAVCADLDAVSRFFDGVPHRLVPDNMKTVVVSAHATTPRVNEAFAEYAQSRGFFVDPARVRRPQDKAGVENSVAYVRRAGFRASSWPSSQTRARIHELQSG